jgi:hypothetical protein
MRLSTKASALAFAALWGGCMLFVGLLNVVFPPYGAGFLHLMSSVYPFYGAAPTVAGVLVGTICGILDGAVAGFLLSWLYNWFLGRMHTSALT